MSQVWEDTISSTLKTLSTFLDNSWTDFIDRHELVSHLGEVDESLEPQLVAARVQKSVLALSKQKFTEDPGWAKQFKAETEWKWMNQLLAAVRLKELTLVKIVRKGRKTGMVFDLSELRESYYGKQILKGLNLGTRRVVDKDEFETVKRACAQIKLTLPESIEPTRTERFFAEAIDDGDGDDEKSDTSDVDGSGDAATEKTP